MTQKKPAKPMIATVKIFEGCTIEFTDHDIEIVYETGDKITISQHDFEYIMGHYISEVLSKDTGPTAGSGMVH